MITITPKSDYDIINACKTNRFVNVVYTDPNDKKKSVSLIYTKAWNGEMYSYYPGPFWTKGIVSNPYALVAQLV